MAAEFARQAGEIAASEKHLQRALELLRAAIPARPPALMFFVPVGGLPHSPSASTGIDSTPGGDRLYFADCDGVDSGRLPNGPAEDLLRGAFV